MALVSLMAHYSTIENSLMRESSDYLAFDKWQRQNTTQRCKILKPKPVEFDGFKTRLSMSGF